MKQVGTLLVQPIFGIGSRRPALLVGLLASLLVAAALAAGSASAEYRHASPMAEFGPSGTSVGNFGNVNSLAYDQAADRLYVIDVSNGIHGFGHPSPGTFTPLGGHFPIAVPIANLDSDLAVDNSAGSTAGNLYLTPDAPTIGSYDSDGSPLATSYSGEGEICGVAVDNVGNIWGGRYPNSFAVRFAPGSPTIAKSVDVSAGAASPCKVAVDPSNNDLYVSSYSVSGVWRYTAASDYTVAQKIGENTGTNNRVVVNGAKHVVYIGGFNSEGKIRAYSTTTGALLETIEPPGFSIRGLAVDEATDTLFVAMGESNKVLEIPGLLTPKASTDAVAESAAVTGTADPDGAGPITQCYFEFGPTTSYGSKQDCAQSLPINASTPVTATLPGLSFETIYHYRLVLATATPGAISKSPDRTLTLHHVKKIETDAATQVNRTKARLNASFEGNGEATSYYFEYGTSTAYGSRFPVAPNEEAVPPSTALEPISAPISGLTPDTTYYFRIVAKNSQGVSPGNVVEFRTPPAVGAVQTEAATAITKTTATLNGSYDGATNDTPPGPLESFHYYFEWGQTGSYGHTTAAPPGLDGGAHAETVHVSAPISGLLTFTPGSAPYHYRLVVSNSTGTTYGPDVTFTTEPPDLPQVSEVRVEGIQPNAATVSASVIPNGAQTSYVVEYGTRATPAYQQATLARSVGAGFDAVAVSTPLEQLAPGTVYHYRVSATSFSGTSVGPDRTFTTSNAPQIESSDASAAATSVRLSATVIANASPTAVRFEYGTGDAYGSVTAPIDAGSSLERATVGTDLGGLQPGTTYHFRALVANGVGGASGPDQTFTTQPGPSQPGPSPVKAKPKPCKRGFLKRRGKCVKKHRKHRKEKKQAGRPSRSGSP